MKEMDQTQSFSRRSFLKISAIWAGGAWIVGVPSILARPYNILTDEQSKIMDALADAIIPPGEFAGGKDAGVTRFIDQQIGRHGYLQHDKEMYQTCLKALNQGAIRDFKQVFMDLNDLKKEEYLKKMEAGHYNNVDTGVGWGEFIPSQFFNTARNHSMMAFYGSPEHGGNIDYVSYRMLGLY